MGGVYDEFAQEMAGWRRRYADRPRQELIHLLLLALEREELVTIGYREAVILRRLATMPISDEIRELIHRALIWVWKDEEMHAIYLRGALFKFGNRRLQALALLRQMAGAIGGWSASVRQHVRWNEAPISRSLATIATWCGSLAGRVPRHVGQHLDYRSFRDYCLFNIEAERTARLCFGHLVELLQSEPDLPPSYSDDFRRIQGDEARHQAIFEIFAAAFDDADRLVAGGTAESLAQKIGGVGEFFLPRLRRSAAADSPLGNGGVVWVVQGTKMADKLPLFRRVLDESGLGHLLKARAQLLGKQVRDLRIGIKAAFIFGYHRQDRSMITDPELIEELARYLAAQGCTEVAVVEGRNVYEKFYQNRSVLEVARYFGIDSPHFCVVDLSEEQVPHAYFRGLAQYTVGRAWKEADFRITFGKMRSHPVDLAYLTLGNLEWIGARCDELAFAERQAQRETAIMMLLDAFPPHFALLDGYELAADGLVGFMGCPHPPSPKRFYAGADALAVDLVAARHLGLKNPRESSTLRVAGHWLGGADGQIEVIGIDESVAGWRSPYRNDLSTLLSFVSFPFYVFGGGRGALFIPEMDEQAFPPVVRPGLWLRLRRRGVQTLLGLRQEKK